MRHPTIAAPAIDQIYQVLRQWAVDRKLQISGDLSRDYKKTAGRWFEPYGSWDVPLGGLHKRLASVGLPALPALSALSALVILQEANEPGAGYWACTPNVPYRPRNDIRRITECDRIVKNVIAQSTSTVLPE